MEKVRKLSVKKLYSIICNEYEGGGRIDLYRSEEKVLKSVLPAMKNKKLLDVGCGTGRWTEAFVKKGADVIGLDFSKEMLGVARKNIQAKFVEGSALQLPFPENSFDIVFSSLTLSTIKNWRRALKEMFRVAKRGGIVMLSDIHGEFRCDGEEGPFLTSKGRFLVPSYSILPSEVFGVARKHRLVELKEIPPNRALNHYLNFKSPKKPVILAMAFEKV